MLKNLYKKIVNNFYYNNNVYYEKYTEHSKLFTQDEKTEFLKHTDKMQPVLKELKTKVEYVQSYTDELQYF